MTEKRTSSEGFDPFSNMVQFYDNWTKAWASTMSETVASERFAQSMAEGMESSVEFMGLIRKQVSDAMESYLQGMNLPTKKEVIDLAERLNRIEMIIDDLDAKASQILGQLRKPED